MDKNEKISGCYIRENSPNFFSLYFSGIIFLFFILAVFLIPKFLLADTNIAQTITIQTFPSNATIKIYRKNFTKKGYGELLKEGTSPETTTIPNSGLFVLIPAQLISNTNYDTDKFYIYRGTFKEKEINIMLRPVSSSSLSINDALSLEKEADFLLANRHFQKSFEDYLKSINILKDLLKYKYVYNTSTKVNIYLSLAKIYSKISNTNFLRINLLVENPEPKYFKIETESGTVSDYMGNLREQIESDTNIEALNTLESDIHQLNKKIINDNAQIETEIAKIQDLEQEETSFSQEVSPVSTVSVPPTVAFPLLQKMLGKNAYQSLIGKITSLGAQNSTQQPQAVNQTNPNSKELKAIADEYIEKYYKPEIQTHQAREEKYKRELSDHTSELAIEKKWEKNIEISLKSFSPNQITTYLQDASNLEPLNPELLFYLYNLFIQQTENLQEKFEYEAALAFLYNNKSMQQLRLVTLSRSTGFVNEQYNESQLYNLYFWAARVLSTKYENESIEKFNQLPDILSTSIERRKNQNCLFYITLAMLFTNYPKMVKPSILQKIYLSEPSISTTSTTGNKGTITKSKEPVAVLLLQKAIKIGKGSNSQSIYLPEAYYYLGLEYANLYAKNPQPKNPQVKNPQSKDYETLAKDYKTLAVEYLTKAIILEPLFLSVSRDIKEFTPYTNNFYTGSSLPILYQRYNLGQISSSQKTFTITTNQSSTTPISQQAPNNQAVSAQTFVQGKTTTSAAYSKTMAQIDIDVLNQILNTSIGNNPETNSEIWFRMTLDYLVENDIPSALAASYNIKNLILYKFINQKINQKMWGE